MALIHHCDLEAFGFGFCFDCAAVEFPACCCCMLVSVRVFVLIEAPPLPTSVPPTGDVHAVVSHVDPASQPVSTGALPLALVFCL